MRPTRCRDISIPADIPADVTISPVSTKAVSSDDLEMRMVAAQIRDVFPMRGRLPAVEKPELRQHEGAGADGCGERRQRGLPPDPCEGRRIRQWLSHHATRHDQDIGLGRVAEVMRRAYDQAMPRPHRTARRCDR
jgi:hypothetical protein